jgi:acetyltransferase-like isoleucine patch superfamily enzyme
MIHSNILLGNNVWIHPTASFNNVRLADNVRIGAKTTLFGRPANILSIGQGSVIGDMTILNGFSAQLSIGEHCTIGALCHFIVDTGPTASPKLLVKYPISEGPITVGNHCVIGHGTMVIAGSSIGDCAQIMPNSFVNGHVPSYTVYGGSPARLIRHIDPNELV